jgi:hypothetical protein
LTSTARLRPACVRPPRHPSTLADAATIGLAFVFVTDDSLSLVLGIRLPRRLIAVIHRPPLHLSSHQIHIIIFFQTHTSSSCPRDSLAPACHRLPLQRPPCAGAHSSMRCVAYARSSASGGVPGGVGSCWIAR